MKKLIIILFICFSANLFSQNHNEDVLFRFKQGIGLKRVTVFPSNPAPGDMVNYQDTICYWSSTTWVRWGFVGTGSHASLTNRDIAGNHAKIIPSSDGADVVGIYKANGTTKQFTVSTNPSTINFYDKYGVLSNQIRSDSASRQNTFIGVNVGSLANLAYLNTAVGYNAGRDNKTGDYNSFFGGFSGSNSSAGIANSFYGYQSGYFSHGDYNTFMGFGSGIGNSNATGAANTFYGCESGNVFKAGVDNTFIGYRSGFSLTDGSYNTFIGDQSGYYNVVGNNNVFLGYKSGYKSINNSNTFLGSHTGYNNTTGHHNVFIGDSAGYDNTTLSNKLFIANTNTSTPIINGTFPNTSIKFNADTAYFSGKIGLGIKNPSSLFHLKATDPDLKLQTTGAGNVGTEKNMKIIYTDYNDVEVASINVQDISAASNRHDMLFSTKHTDGTLYEDMRLRDGKLGIGTTLPTAPLQIVGIVEYADNTAALAAGLTAGAFYRTGDLLKVVH
jgi:hypothetical protein